MFSYETGRRPTQEWCSERQTPGEPWKSSSCPHHVPVGTAEPAAPRGAGTRDPLPPPACPRMPRWPALCRRAEPTAKATDWGPTPQFQGQSPSLGSYHKKRERPQLIKGLWIKSNIFRVQTQTLGCREQPVAMPGAAGGSQLAKHRLGLPEGHCRLQKCSLPQPLKQKN